jgi:type II secretory pathway component PulK
MASIWRAITLASGIQAFYELLQLLSADRKLHQRIAFLIDRVFDRLQGPLLTQHGVYQQLQAAILQIKGCMAQLTHFHK